LTAAEATGIGAVDSAVLWAGVIAVVCAAGFGLWRVLRVLARLVATGDDFRDDWRGSPARPGVAARPGVMERMATIEGQTGQIPRLVERVEAIEHEMHPNGGDSLRDQLDIVVREIAPGPNSQNSQ
jgi:hypothetical protein